jgi:hemerythrin-like domain-containing protein
MNSAAEHLPPPAEAATLDGFELLDICHRQTLFTLGKLAALLSRLGIHGADSEARTMATEIVRHFSTTAHAHHEDEERHVFPRLLAEGDPEIAEAVQRLKQDHAWLELDWRELEPLLKAIAEGHCGVDLDLLREGATIFIALSHDHMTLEEACIYPQARARLTAGERREAGREMAAGPRHEEHSSLVALARPHLRPVVRSPRLPRMADLSLCAADPEAGRHHQG